VHRHCQWQLAAFTVITGYINYRFHLQMLRWG